MEPEVLLAGSIDDSFRSGLKAEIGILFPMLILRVLENVLQPSFLQKMTILNLLDKIGGNSQIIIYIFVNYDCDVDSPNIFERVVNGLLKTSLRPPSGSTTTLSTVQDIFLRHELVQCLVSIIKSMGAWMDQQLKIDTATLEQHRAYKIELQKGGSLFNRKPFKGIEFLINTKNVGNSSKEVAAFLKNNTAGLSEIVIGDYLGEKEEFALRVMHTYVAF
ncbi:hypothetical protein GOBAR_AA25511 [Gossypium barbadense]|uniref:SEC7 domain-containing protein n=1 Tax=Gossypium barbadense TaxID=3634 RepID=A0A2P5WVM7_GOSBA|nr:hypothetical protein GOBAR_AA25511 [Gossypium barbadense]